MILDTLHIDNYLKFEHSAESNSTADDNISIGATVSTTARALPFTPSDSNSVFVSKSGNDSSGDGTLANPYLTISHAVTQCTVSKQYIVINDNDVYDVASMTLTGNCKGVISNIGYDPTLNVGVDHNSENLQSINSTTITSNDANYTGIVLIDAFMLKNGNHVEVIRSNTSPYPATFRIYDTERNIIKDETTIASATGSKVKGCCLNNGNFVLAYEYSSNIYTLLYSSDGTLITGATNIANGIAYNTSYTILDIKGIISTDNYFVITYIERYSQVVSWRIFNSSFTGVNSLQTISVDAITATNRSVIVLPLSNSNFLMLLSIGDDATLAQSYGIFSKTGTAVLALTDLSAYYPFSSSNYGVRAVEDTNNDILLFGGYGASNTLAYMKVSGTDGSILISATTISVTAAAFVILWAAERFETDKIILFHSGSSQDTTMKVTILDESFTKIYESGDLSGWGTLPNYTQIINIDNDRYLANWTRYVTSTYQTDWVLVQPSFDLINYTVDTILSGLNIVSTGITKNITALFSGTAALTLSFCNITDILYNTCYLINSTGALNLSYCKVTEGYYGIKVSSNTVDVHNCSFNEIPNGPAVIITGSGTGIAFNHNTFFNNNTGIELVDNAGTEVIKNCIFSNNAVGIKAEAELLVKNCCITDALDNVTYDSTSTTLNPLFVSDGFMTAVNLHLQSKVLGYAYDSPALALGDDGKDAGCYDVIYTINPASYTSFIIPKPNTIKPNIVPVGMTVNTMQDGTVDVGVDGYQLEIEMQWDAIKKKYISDIVKLFMAKSNGDIRIYFNPSTYPDNYENMKLTTKELPLGGELYSLSEYGFTKIKMEFVRPFSLGELV